MAFKYLKPGSLNEREKAQLRKVLNFKLKEIQGKLKDLDKKPKKAKKAKR